jgi:hypothetical protein
MLIPPLNFDRRVHNNLVSASSTGAPATMSAPDNQPPPILIARPTSPIMAQLTMMSNRLDLQGATLACHAQRLDNAEGFDASNTNTTTLITAPTGGQGNGSNDGIGGAESSASRPPQPPRDHREDLRNSFHQPKIKFPRYDGESDPPTLALSL